MPQARSAVAIVLGSLLILSPAHGQSVREHPRVQQAVRLVHTWLDAQRAYDQIPAMSGALVHDQEVLWSGGLGYADLATRAPATPETVYSICSISKLFTSVALMQLRDAGALRLDDPVARHLPWFDIRRTATDAPEITVEGILTHSSGLPREANAPYWTGPDYPFPTREAIVTGLREQETLYPASQYFQYSNLGLTLVGEIVAAKAGESYDAYVRRMVLQPLGLNSTYPEMPEALRGGRLATGYGSITRSGRREQVPFFQARGIAPAAGFASTADDLARFAAWNFRVLAGKGSEVLKPNTLREMQRVHWVDPDFGTHWGLGFSVWRDGDKTFTGHGGSCPGYRSQLLMHPQTKVAAVFLANAMVNSGGYAQRMYDIIAPAVAFATDTTRKPPTRDATLQRYLGSYDDAPWGGETAVVEWEDGLALLSLPTMNPVRDLMKIRKVEGAEHTFRRVRRDGSLGETIRFELGPDGKAIRYWQHNNPSPRLPVGG